MHKLSVCITTLNNDRTLLTCLQSVAWTDEIVIVDSGSTDNTRTIASNFINVRIIKKDFLGYGPQKMAAIQLCSNQWVLLLDADEALSTPSQEEIKKTLINPSFPAWELPRREQLFWKMNHSLVRENYYLRLFRKDSITMDDNPVHASPKTSHKYGRLTHVFYHFSETSIHTKTEKINNYSNQLTSWSWKRGKRARWYHLSIYPAFVFIKVFVFKRNFLNGGAGFINSISAAHYAFLRYAKLYEFQKHKLNKTGPWPDNAPNSIAKHIDTTEK